jgi:hypothetical protein
MEMEVSQKTCVSVEPVPLVGNPRTNSSREGKSKDHREELPAENQEFFFIGAVRADIIEK